MITFGNRCAGGRISTILIGASWVAPRPEAAESAPSRGYRACNAAVASLSRIRNQARNTRQLCILVREYHSKDTVDSKARTARGTQKFAWPALARRIVSSAQRDLRRGSRPLSPNCPVLRRIPGRRHDRPGQTTEACLMVRADTLLLHALPLATLLSGGYGGCRYGPSLAPCSNSVCPVTEARSKRLMSRPDSTAFDRGRRGSPITRSFHLRN